ncbi:uncharacterized protein STEHIDRAFT_123429 [Stereum hirsutum FP-91666 SS1]|uniref:uncharacterized protein n=1 Tax=Stereum hirsutum (strain FP-91666) TaxID=721885 RepID=UPI0004449353|nr:uncharacterized protein STEHIDRAFT_123429 [Stereum hirsutum FP-91666 SS1]EIM83850.1 hypothetical protein STEHIDRAFT_123429 [Stereum hirsutum FP-91666 SS1]
MSHKASVPTHLVALPSVSASLSSLPQVKSMANVSIHTPSHLSAHAAESEAKLKKALSKNSANLPSSQSIHYGAIPSTPSNSSQPLMMRKPVRTK